MADEAKTDTSEILPSDFEEQLYAEAKAELDKQLGAMDEPAKTKDQSESEPIKTEEKKEEQEKVEEEPQPEPAAEKIEEKKEPAAEEKTGTEEPKAKSLYTPEEIESELKLHGDLAKLDSSRLDAQGKLLQKSMQRGLTPKLQEAARLREERDQLAQRIRAEEEKRAKAEAERLYQEEREQYGEDMASIRKEIRELKDLREQERRERDAEKAALQAEHEKMAAQQAHYIFMEKAKDYGIPATEEWENIVVSRVVSDNMIRAKNNEPFMSLEDGMRAVADTVGLNSVDSIEKVLAANPKLREALENKIMEKIAKKKTAGPTVFKPSGSGNKVDVKSQLDEPKNPILDNPDADLDEFAIKYAKELMSKQST
ncbi:MAG: hypothetical protein ABIH23_09200 [bacterium]